MPGADRRAGYWNRERETMSAGAREAYQTRWLTALLALAWDKAPGVRRRLEAAKLSPKDIRSTEDLARLPVIRKSAMPDLQKADPPFGGFCTEPVAKLRKIFVSPGPIRVCSTFQGDFFQSPELSTRNAMVSAASPVLAISA